MSENTATPEVEVAPAALQERRERHKGKKRRLKRIRDASESEPEAERPEKVQTRPKRRHLPAEEELEVRSRASDSLEAAPAGKFDDAGDFVIEDGQDSDYQEMPEKPKR
jgi:hypothetical protein